MIPRRTHVRVFEREADKAMGFMMFEAVFMRLCSCCVVLRTDPIELGLDRG